MLSNRVSTHDEELAVGLKSTMSRSGRQHGNVACLYGNLLPPFPSQDQLRSSARKAQYFMSGRVVMMEVIDTIPPLSGPPVSFEGFFHDSCRISRGIKRSPVKKHR